MIWDLPDLLAGFSYPGTVGVPAPGTPRRTNSISTSQEPVLYLYVLRVIEPTGCARVPTLHSITISIRAPRAALTPPLTRGGFDLLVVPTASSSTSTSNSFVHPLCGSSMRRGRGVFGVLLLGSVYAQGALGENLYWQSSSGTLSTTAKDPIQSWCGEKFFYNFGPVRLTSLSQKCARNQIHSIESKTAATQT
eukprot:1449879-Rhodomonas_salina.2